MFFYKVKFNFKNCNYITFIILPHLKHLIQMSLKKRGFVYVAAAMVIMFASCISSENITYFNNLPDSARIGLSSIAVPSQKIQVNDLLSIRVGGDNEKIVQYINQYFGGSTVAGGSAGGLQCIVDETGNIELPKIGKVKLAGLSRDEAAANITKAYSEYIIGAIVTVQYVNFRFAVLGEVGSPGYYTIPNERINLFEAVAQAGDMTDFALRDNVKLIRDENGQRQVISLNFNDKNILNTPWYYLDRNDIIYVAPRQAKVNSQNLGPAVTILSSVLSLTAIFFTIFRK